MWWESAHLRRRGRGLGRLRRGLCRRLPPGLDRRRRLASTPKIAHEWHRMTDSDKVRYVDSMRVYLDSSTKLVRARAAQSDSIARVSMASHQTSRRSCSPFPRCRTSRITRRRWPNRPCSRMRTTGCGSSRPYRAQTGWRTTTGSLRRRRSGQRRLVDRVAIPAGSTSSGFGQGIDLSLRRARARGRKSRGITSHGCGI